MVDIKSRKYKIIFKIFISLFIVVFCLILYIGIFLSSNVTGDYHELDINLYNEFIKHKIKDKEINLLYNNNTMYPANFEKAQSVAEEAKRYFLGDRYNKFNKSVKDAKLAESIGGAVLKYVFKGDFNGWDHFTVQYVRSKKIWIVAKTNTGMLGSGGSCVINTNGKVMCVSDIRT